jgi:hypothetical protein
MATWPYRGSLDCVVEAPDGRFAAYVLVWPDDENGVGLFEPVGTRGEFRRRGLGAAVCTFGLQRLHEEGMRRASSVATPSPPARCTSRSAFAAAGRSRHMHAEAVAGRSFPALFGNAERRPGHGERSV